MGNSVEEKPKTEVLSSPSVDHNNIPMYPDWGTMQAYYAPRFALPSYHNSAAPSHVPPTYMWGPPQSMLPRYGAPYAAFYAHGGVYAHPGFHLHGAALTADTPVKLTRNADGGFVKKMKELNGLSMSIGHGNGDTEEDAADNSVTQSEETEDTTNGGSNGSYGVTAAAGPSGTKRRHQRSPNTAGNGKVLSIAPVSAAPQISEKVANVIPSAPIRAKTAETINTALELRDPTDLNMKSSPNDAQQVVIQSEVWLQNERELKREKRKLSNRESARRSRLRKQAEYEELAIKVQALTSENIALKSDINKLLNHSKRVKLENAAFMDKLKGTQLGLADETDQHKIKNFRKKPDGTVNLLARVNYNSDTSDRGIGEDETFDSKIHGAKLRQLLDTRPRTDAVAAS